jgi:hypothetical protein
MQEENGSAVCRASGGRGDFDCMLLAVLPGLLLGIFEHSGGMPGNRDR